jgi:hypothetical protein
MHRTRPRARAFGNCKYATIQRATRVHDHLAVQSATFRYQPRCCFRNRSIRNAQPEQLCVEPNTRAAPPRMHPRRKQTRRVECRRKRRPPITQPDHCDAAPYLHRPNPSCAPLKWMVP